MTTWIISGWVHLIIGVAIGWLVFKQPQFITDGIARLLGRR